MGWGYRLEQRVKQMFQKGKPGAEVHLIFFIILSEGGCTVGFSENCNELGDVLLRRQEGEGRRVGNRPPSPLPPSQFLCSFPRLHERPSGIFIPQTSEGVA